MIPLLFSKFINYLGNNKKNTYKFGEEDINSVLDNVLEKYNVDINDLNLKLDNSNKIFNNDEFNDNKRPLKNFFTDFVNNHILDEHNLYNLLYIINKLYNDTIKKYIKKNNLKDDDILFIFKGGNIFKLVAEKFWSELPNQAMYKLIDEYKKYFKRSDLDFGIYINPKLNKSIIITKEITIISYKIQLIINEIIFNNKNIFLKWFKYNNSYQNSIIEYELNNLNKLDILSDNLSTYYNNKFTNIHFITNSRNYINQHDALIEYSIYKNDIKQVDHDNADIEEFYNKSTVNNIISNPLNKKSFMYTSINKALNIDTKEDDTTNTESLKFNLTRTKINFNLVMQNNNNSTKKNLSIGGELIDVSIGYDTTVWKFYKKKTSFIHNILLKKNNESFNINIYSYEYLYLDLDFILFKIIYLPWIDIKYKKRLYRVFYITFIDLFTTIKNNNLNNRLNNKHIKIFIQYYKLIYNIINKFKNNQYTKNNIDKISKLLSKSKFDELISNFKCKKNCLLFDLLFKINIIIEKVLYPKEFINTKIHNNKDINSDINNNRILDNNELINLLEFIHIVKNNLNNLLIVNTYLINYCEKNIIFDYKDIDSSLLL